MTKEQIEKIANQKRDEHIQNNFIVSTLKDDKKKRILSFSALHHEHGDFDINFSYPLPHATDENGNRIEPSWPPKEIYL